MVNVLKLLHQLNVKDVSVTCFGTSIPSSGVKYVRLKPTANDKILFSKFCCLHWAQIFVSIMSNYVKYINMFFSPASLYNLVNG